jgi:hypothetical protein
MAPKTALIDFEEALTQGFEHIFPEASVLGDFFHFVQTNVKKIGELGFKNLASEVVVGMNKVWGATPKAAFDREVLQFLTEWDDRMPAYTSYFRKNWLDRYHSEKWAAYARADDDLSGIKNKNNHYSYLLLFILRQDQHVRKDTTNA